MQLAQACHGAFEFATAHPEVMRKWMETSNYIVVLAVPDEEALLAHADRLTGWCADQSMKGIPFTLVHEPDINEHTALVIAPSSYWMEISHLPLALKEAAMV